MNILEMKIYIYILKFKGLKHCGYFFGNITPVHNVVIEELSIDWG